MATLSSGHRPVLVAKRPPISLIGFLLLTFAISWIGAAPIIFDSWYPDILPAGMGFIQVLMFFGTALVTLFVTWWNDGWTGVRRLLGGLLKWRVGLRWYAFVLFAPAALFWSALQISSLGRNEPMALQQPMDLLISFSMIFGGYVLLNTEEIAWRGYALPRLMARYSRWHASLILGVILGVFHIPLFLIKGGHPAGYPFLFFLVMIIALTVIFTWLMQHTGASLLLAHVFHQSFNAWAESIPFFPAFTGDLRSFMVTIGLLVLAAFLIVRQWALR